MNARLSQLWQRFRDPSKEFKRAHIEALFTIIREQQSQIEQLEAPVKEVMTQSEDFDGVNTIAYIRALHKKMEGQRKHIATLQAHEQRFKAALDRIYSLNDRDVVEASAIAEEALGHGNATADADRQVSARTAGEAPASDGDSACPAVPASIRAYDEAMQAAGVPHEPLQVYDSNSWRRVGLARQYREVMAPTVLAGHPDIRGTDVLVALVAAFNAMLEFRQEPQL